MLRRFFNIYKIPLLVSLTLFFAILAITTERNALDIIYILIGAFFGTFIMDLDYLMHIYFVEPEHKNSGIVKDYIKHLDLIGYLVFVNTHSEEFEKKTFHSALFQVILGLAAILIVSSSSIVILKALLLSAFANSIYRFLEVFFNNKAKEWFWSFKVETSSGNMYLFLLVLLAELTAAFIIL